MLLDCRVKNNPFAGNTNIYNTLATSYPLNATKISVCSPPRIDNCNHHAVIARRRETKAPPQHASRHRVQDSRHQECRAKVPKYQDCTARDSTRGSPAQFPGYQYVATVTGNRCFSTAVSKYSHRKEHTYLCHFCDISPSQRYHNIDVFVAESL